MIILFLYTSCDDCFEVLEESESCNLKLDFDIHTFKLSYAMIVQTIVLIITEGEVAKLGTTNSIKEDFNIAHCVHDVFRCKLLKFNIVAFSKVDHGHY
jgi:hypothetical protein